MFVRSVESAAPVRRRFAAVAAKIAQRYVEVQNSTALLSVMVDWVLFPQAEYASPEVVLADVDAFSGGKSGNGEA